MQPPFPHIDIDRLVDAAKLCYPRIGTKDQNRNQFGSIQILGKEPSSNLVPSTGPQIEGVTKKKAQAPLEGPIKKKKKISKGVEVRDLKEENEKAPTDVNKVPSEKKKKKKKSTKEAEVLAFKQIPTGEAEIQVVLEVTGEKKKKKKKIALATDVLVEKKKKKKSKSKETEVQVAVEITEKKKKEIKEVEVPPGVNEVPKVEKKKKKKSKETDAVQKAEITVEKKKKKKHSAANPVSDDKEKKKKTDCAPAAQ